MSQGARGQQDALECLCVAWLIFAHGFGFFLFSFQCLQRQMKGRQGNGLLSSSMGSVKWNNWRVDMVTF